MQPADAVLRFVESIGRPGEAEFYLGLFRAQDKERFAVISVEASVAHDSLDAVALDLRFLAQLGLTPVVVLGVVDPGHAVPDAARLARKLERAQVRAEVLEETGTEQGVADLAARVTRAAHDGVLPVVPMVPGEGATVDSRFARLGGLLSALQTRKLIFLSRRGALRQRGAAIPLVNLTTEFEPLSSSRELTPKQRALVRQARTLLFERVSHPLLIAVTSPLDLLRELFTTKGAGTLLRRGAVVRAYGGFDEVDLLRLRGLIASAFGRSPADDFFARPVRRIYIEENYRGAAIVVDTPLGAYLTKFAVERAAQGEGIGRDLWQHLVAEFATVFWRARARNPVGRWYAEQCDGLCRFSEWHVFWRGVAPENIPAILSYALGAPVDIQSLAPGADEA